MRKAPIRHVVKEHLRQGVHRVRSHYRGTGYKQIKLSESGVPEYLSPSGLLKAGFGKGSRVELISRQLGFNGQPMDRKFSHPVGSVGTVTGLFGKEVKVKWDDEPRAEQVVNPSQLRVFEGSHEKEEIITSEYDKVRRNAAKWGYEFLEDEGKGGGNKITIRRTQPVMDDNGFIVGDVSFELQGHNFGKYIHFDTPKLDLSSVPRKYRPVWREYWESRDPLDEFKGVVED